MTLWQIKYKSSIFKSEIFSGKLVLVTFFSVQLLTSALTSSSHAGAYIFADEVNGVDIVTHPTGYLGAGGELTVGICIDPSTNSTIANDMQISMQNIVDTFNDPTVTTGNLKIDADNDIPDFAAPDFLVYIDFESVALHEIGHCIGLAHVNASSESELPDRDSNYTKATDGIDGVFNILPGADNIKGSSDDIRGDDVNLHWFNIGMNNPFEIVFPIDSSTYARTLAGNLPGGHTFAANADRSLGAFLGFSNTEAVMQQGTGSDEAQRTLVADDVATLKYAMSGLDEIAGNADDYTLKLEYRGITNVGCDITVGLIADVADDTLAFCSPSGLSAGKFDHVRIVDADIKIGQSYNLFYNSVRNGAADITPDSFTLTDQENVALNATITSTSILVSGINSSAMISVSGGEYSINEGVFTSDAGVVNNGNTVRVRHTSAPTILLSTNTLLTIDSISDTFTSTTSSVQDAIPNSFSFISKSDVEIGALVSSSGTVISGITIATPISVSGGEYSINSGSFVSVDGFVDNGELVVVRHTASAVFSTLTTTTLTVGGVVGKFTSTTRAATKSGGGGGMLNPLMILVFFFLYFVGDNFLRIRRCIIC